jgi:hypothetical protein
MEKLDFGSYMNLVGSKINAAKGDLISKQRNERGFMETAARIRKGAENLYFSLGAEVFEPVDAMFTAFSARPGMNDVSNVQAVDIIDIGIQATQQSIMGYLSVERAMDKPSDIAWYQGLVASNSVGGIEAGQEVFSPFSPTPKGLNLGTVVTTGVAEADSAVQDEVKIQLPKFPVEKKGVVLVATLTSGSTSTVVATGTDLKGDGVIYWDNGTACDSAVVNYDTGLITITNVADESVITQIAATANIERTSQADGSSTLKVRPKTKTIQLVSTPNRIILENNYEDNMYINKQAYDLSAIGVNLDFSKKAINQLLQTYVAYLDGASVGATASVMLGQAPSETLDYTDYVIATSEASTKNDIVNQYILKLNKSLQVKSGKGPTAYLVDSEGAIILGNNPMYFTGNPSFDANLDGMIGTYHGIPVIRHHALNNICDTATETYGFIGALYKSPDGQAAPTIYGEYLPPYSITPALNYDNPAQYSQALLSQSVTQSLVPELASYMLVLVATTT